MKERMVHRKFIRLLGPEVIPIHAAVEVRSLSNEERWRPAQVTHHINSHKIADGRRIHMTTYQVQYSEARDVEKDVPRERLRSVPLRVPLRGMKR